MRDAVTRVADDTRSSARGVQRQDGLDVDVEGWRVERFKHDLRHLLSVGFRVEWRLGEKHRVFLWGHTELVVEGVVPDLLHVVPVGDDAMFQRVLEGEHPTVTLGLVTDVRLLLSHTNHNVLVYKKS